MSSGREIRLDIYERERGERDREIAKQAFSMSEIVKEKRAQIHFSIYFFIFHSPLLKDKNKKKRKESIVHSLQLALWLLEEELVRRGIISL